MAKIGLRYPVYKTSFTQGVIAKAIQADIAISVNDVKLYADDIIAETDKSFQNGTVTLGVDELSDNVYATLLGHTVDGITGELTADIDDVAPFVGIGFYGVKKVNNVAKYRAIWLPKVQFAEPADTNSTKGETTTFNTPVIVGTIMVDGNGDWKKENTFTTEAEAKAYLDAKAGITPQCTMPVASKAAGTYEGTQSIVLTAGAGETIYYTTNGTTPSASSTEYETAISIAETTMLRAIAIKAGSSNSQIASYEYIITA